MGGAYEGVVGINTLGGWRLLVLGYILPENGRNLELELGYTYSTGELKKLFLYFYLVLLYYLYSITV